MPPLPDRPTLLHRQNQAGNADWQPGYPFSIVRMIDRYNLAIQQHGISKTGTVAGVRRSPISLVESGFGKSCCKLA